MILTNKREMYDVENSSTEIKLNGNITIKSDKTIETFNGSFLEISSGNYVGSFNYNDTADKVSVNYNNLTKSVQDKCEEILESTITAIKAQTGE